MYFVKALLLLSLVFGSTDQKIITVEFGQDVTLTCRAQNNNNIVGRWSRADLETEYVLLYRDNLSVPDHQHPSFKNRVDLQDRQMEDGDVSLILKDVTINDAGTYKCRIVTRGTRSWKSIIIIYLRAVDPPGQNGGLTEDGGKEDGVSRGCYRLIASGLLLLVFIFFFVIATKLPKKNLSSIF